MYKVLLVDDEYMILQGLTMIIDWQTLKWLSGIYL